MSPVPPSFPEPDKHSLTSFKTAASDETVHRATQVRTRIRRARIQLMMKQTFLSAAIGAFPVIPAHDNSWCHTMATDGTFIYYNIDWTDSLTDDEIQFVLAHEVMHCVLGHIDRRGNRNPSVWNDAIDYATNALLLDCGLQMPEHGLYDSRLRNMTAERIYDYLISKKYREVVEGHNPTRDAHLSPDDMRTAGARRLAVGREERETLDSLTENERLSLRREAIRQMRVSIKLAGKHSASLEQEIEAAAIPQVSWQTFLAQFVTGLNRNDYRMYPFSKKHIWRGLFLPSVGIPGPKHLIIVVDTSGSMSEQELSIVLSEVDRLRASCECDLTLIQADALVNRVDCFSPYESSQFTDRRYTVCGRGGTDFRPAFDWVQDAVINGRIEMPDALVYLTDGYGVFPASEPPFPVLWIGTPRSIAKENYPFGAVIILKEQ